MMENAFCFILKTLFVLKISSFLSRLFGIYKKPLDWKVTVDFKSYDVTTG